MHLEFELLRQPDVVLIGEGHVGSLGGLEQGEEVVSGTAGGRTGGQYAEAIGEAMRVLVENPRRAVGGSIIARDNCYVRQRLREDRIDLFAQEAFAVVGREQDLYVSARQVFKRQRPPRWSAVRALEVLQQPGSQPVRESA